MGDLPDYFINTLTSGSVFTSGGVVQISGQVVSISGQPVTVSLSGLVVNISGMEVSLSGEVVSISGQMSGVQVWLMAGGISGAQISGAIVQIAGGVNVSGQVVSVSGQLSGTTVQLAGGVNVSGQTVYLASLSGSISGTPIVGTQGASALVGMGIMGTSTVAQLIATALSIKSVTVKASPTNSGQVYLGIVNTAAASGTAVSGFRLDPGDAATWAVNDLSKVWWTIDSVGSGMIYWFAIQP